MKGRKSISIAVLSAMSVTLTTLALRTRVASGTAAQGSGRVVNELSAARSGYLSNATIKSVAISSAMQIDDGSPVFNPTGPLIGVRGGHRILPPIEELTLTPPNPLLKTSKTTLAVQFSDVGGLQMPSQVPMVLGDQNVILRRSADRSTVFTTSLDFDWKAFADEQQQRQNLALSGQRIPVFEGRRIVRMDEVRFVDPNDIREALKSHQPINFTSQVLESPGNSIDPDHELMITDLSVVEDSTRTWDLCNPTGTQSGAWTFATLVTAMAGGDQQKADEMVTNWLMNWTSGQPVNGFTVQPRNSMQTQVINPWLLNHPDPQNPNWVDVNFSPMRLNAIVNRVDLGQGSGSITAGELRFVFGLLNPTCPAENHGQGPDAVHFNVILEYGVPISGCSGSNGVQHWAEEWHGLDQFVFGVGTSFNSNLQAITDQVVTAGAGGSKPFGSAIDQVRTNEEFLVGTGIWEQREFHLQTNLHDSSPDLAEATISQTPDQSFNGAQGGANGFVVTDFINLFGPQIIAGNYSVPDTWSDPIHPIFNGSVLGGSIFNGASEAGFWNGSPTPGSHLARVDFSMNTCNGCHSRETATNPSFQQVVNRQAVPGNHNPSALSGFLVGCTQSAPLQNDAGCTLLNINQQGQELVLDPVTLDPNNPNPFGDIARRAGVLQGLLNGCSSGQLLQGLIKRPVNFVH
jgi:hypothetical protein